MRRTILIASLVVLLLATLPALDQADADDADYELWYCYHDQIRLEYPYYQEGMTVEWDVEMGDERLDLSGPIVGVDASGHDRVRVTQTVRDGSGTEDAKTIDIVVIPTEEDPIHVVFIDRDMEYYRYTIDTGITVRFGEDFVVLPVEPSREGYRFTGWYYDSGTTNSFDTKVPVLDDLYVYAGWTERGGSGSQTIIVDNTHTVTFDVQTGLNCEILSNSGRTVTFSVSIQDGYSFREGSIVAASDGGSVSSSNGIYTLSGIDRDIIVTVTGDRLYAVEYRLSDGLTVQVDGYEEPPSLVPGGPLTIRMSEDAGDITVLMGGINITSTTIDGTTVHIESVVDNVIIIAYQSGDAPATPDGPDESDGFPWWIIVLVVVIAAAVAVAYAYRRGRRAA